MTIIEEGLNAGLKAALPPSACPSSHQPRSQQLPSHSLSSRPPGLETRPHMSAGESPAPYSVFRNLRASAK